MVRYHFAARVFATFQHFWIFRCSYFHIPYLSKKEISEPRRTVESCNYFRRRGNDELNITLHAKPTENVNQECDLRFQEMDIQEIMNTEVFRCLGKLRDFFLWPMVTTRDTFWSSLAIVKLSNDLQYMRNDGWEDRGGGQQ